MKNKYIIENELLSKAFAMNYYESKYALDSTLMYLLLSPWDTSVVLFNVIQTTQLTMSSNEKKKYNKISR
jgi:hypothetical protein